MQNQPHFNIDSGTVVNTGLDDGSRGISSTINLLETENCWGLNTS
jgi:hypothetical protein